MTRAVGAALVAGLLLAACGSVNAATATANWVAQSGFLSSVKTLVGDAQHSATALRNTSMASSSRHTVCEVLFVDTQTANASLPTPDATSTALLSAAYTDLGRGASRCYGATNVAARDGALLQLSLGLAKLSEATARVASASLP